jgi:nanoRNase/pAp phosphatase (c-di-AMP/oligoRNAs hydrolase)
MYLNEDKKAKFTKIIGTIKGQFNIIVNEVDPDALGAALGLSAIIETLNHEAKSSIYYCGTIGRAQNVDVFNKYGLENSMKPITEWSNDENIINMLVDSSRIDDSRLPDKLKAKPLVIIDHHKTENLIEGEAQFYWIDNVGASCTMIVELMRSMAADKIDLKSDEYNSLAVMLALGIYTDTESKINANKRDKEAYDFITKDLDLEDFNQLLDYDYPPEYYDCLFKALGNRVQEGSRLVAGVGNIEESEGSMLAMIAEHLMKNSSVTIVVVWGILNDQIKVSARSRGLGIRLDDFLKKRFGKEYSGGRINFRGKGAGGGNIPLQFGILKGDSSEFKDSKEALIKAWMKQQVFSI